jgi:hypothetical protein
VEISIAIDEGVLKAVDAFVDEHDESDRGKVIAAALRLWYAAEQERAMEAQFSAPQSPEEREERAAWRHIQAAAAERIFRPRSSRMRCATPRRGEIWLVYTSGQPDDPHQPRPALVVSANVRNRLSDDVT